MANFALALGIATRNSASKIIEAYFPAPILAPKDELVCDIKKFVNPQDEEVASITAPQCGALADIFSRHQQGESSSPILGKSVVSDQSLILVILTHDGPPKSVAEAFLKLHLISHRLVLPHEIILDGIFDLLHNIAWTNEGPIDLPELADRQVGARLSGRSLSVYSVDKFPRMADYVVPRGVRIADASRVRLGAYIGEGTTIMHEGFVNFNAGTTGVSMVEGRVSAGVLVNDGSDIGGGASIMGTLSGGGKVVVSVGKNSLIGANSGLGFPLGDRCTIESGLYVTAGTKVHILDRDGNQVKIVKARDLAGVCDLLFRRNSSTGRVECLTNKSAVRLNKQLHTNT